MSGTGYRNGSSADACVRAIERGVAYVTSRSGRDGLWRDFETLAGESSQWVTGFVAYALAQTGADRDASEPALAALAERQRAGGGWSYNDGVPPDCDSTAWSLLALSTLAQPRPSTMRRGARYLRRHQDRATGGFATYATFDAIDACIRAPDPETVKGWRSPHTCVTAVAILALLAAGRRSACDAIPAAARYLRERRHPSGLWHGYWWKDPAYATYHALKALHWAGSLDDATLRAAQCAMISRQRDDGATGNAFETAFAVLTLLLDADAVSAAAAERGVMHLLARQDVDGSWPSEPILRIPPPMTRDPDGDIADDGTWEGTGIVVADRARLFTSAAALWAIAVYRQSAGLSRAVMHAVKKC